LLLLFAPFVSSAAQDNFESHRQKAEAARDSGRADDAIQEYQSALQSKPDWAEGWWYLGTLDYDSNRFPDAIVAFKKLVDLQPQAGPVWNLLGLSEFETKDYDNALPHLQRGIELGLDDNPGAGKVAKYHAALLLVRNGEFRQAADLLAGEFSQGPVPDQIKGVLGLALLRVPLLPEQVDPSKDSLLHSAGDAAALLMQKNADAAFLSLEQMLKDYPAAPFLHYIDAVALFSAQRNADALAHLREQIRITPGFAPAHDLLGQILEREGKFDLAAKEKAAALQAPKDAEAKALIAAYARGSVAAPAKSGPVPAGDFDELARQGAAAQREGRLDEAIQYSRRALDLNPQWEEGWAMLGTLYYMTGRCPLALPALKNSIEMNPKRSEAWALMGICEYQGQDNKNALIHLQHAQALGLAANPTGIKIAKYHIAYLLNLNGEFEQATDLLVNEIGPSPVFDEIKLALGIALLRIPKLPEQLDAAQKALAAKAGEIASLLAESRFEQSWPLFQEMLKQAPDTPFLHYAYGVALFSNSQYADAEAQLREEIRISPQSALPYRRLASIALLLHHPDDALASAQQAVKLAPDAAESRYLAGRAYLELKRGEEAVRELEIAARLAPNSPEVHFNLAKAYARVGQNDAAERERAAFTRLNAMAEQEKSTHGSQTYAGSHAGSGLAGGSASTPNPE
jgi:tetratricopeptide (TPR) repeat protein